MVFDNDSAVKISEFLLQIKAVQLQPNDPFSWASGWRSPIYCDNRKTLSYPQVRTYIRQEFVRVIAEKYPNAEIIAGVATGGIAIGALVAQELGLPFAYVRSSAKKHGMTNQIEGVVESGSNVVVIEDLISTGKSSLNAVAALREHGANVKGLISIFTYNFPFSEQNFTEAKCEFTSLSDYKHLIETALEKEYINQDQLSSLQAWRTNPADWNVEKA